MPKRQLAAIPYVIQNGQPLVLLVTSRETRRWVVPKGWPEKGRGDADQAAREAYEEAGVLGAVARTPIGSFRYSKRLKDGRDKPVAVDVHLLEVEEVLDDWPEADERERRWMTPAQAAMAVQEGALAALLLGLPVTMPRVQRRKPSRASDARNVAAPAR